MLKFYYTALGLLFMVSQALAQQTVTLKQQLEQIIAGRQATVGVAIAGEDNADTLTINGSTFFPMQSVFKLHIAVAVLNLVDQGKFSLDKKIVIRKEDLSPTLYSPIREKYPDGATLTLEEILGYTVSQSDNVGCDILLKLVGGTNAVEDYLLEKKFTDVKIKFTEQQQQAGWNLQYQNCTTPLAANFVLESFYNNKAKLLSKTNYDFFWKLMKQTATGQKRLKGQLPPGVIVAHKTGTSGMNKDGLTAAVNDIGVIFIPGGRHFFISVFITDSKEDAETNEKIIAEISKAAWDYFIKATQ